MRPAVPSKRRRAAWSRKTRMLCAVWALLAMSAGCQAPNATGFLDTSPSPGGEGRISTAPASPSPPPTRFTFAVKGDWGAGTPEQAAVTQQMCLIRQTSQFEVVVTTGDNFYNPDSVATETNYYRPESCLLAHPGHTWRASWGNHDVSGDSTDVVLGAERSYRWSGGDVEFFVLDSNRAADPAQTEWLEAQLKEAEAPVKVAVFHHAPFTAGLHENNQDVIRNWVPLFERYGITLVLTGHNHGYEHWIVNGIHYVVSGGGGAQIYPCADQKPPLLKCLAINHFLLVEAVGNVLTITTIDAAGAEVDSFVVKGR